MFEFIGSLIDNLLMIGGGIFLLAMSKKINKSYIKWLAILIIVCGVLLTFLDFKDKDNSISQNNK